MTDAELLVGVWIMRGEEVRTAEFHADGTLTYAIEVENEPLIMNLTWRVENGMIVSGDDTRSGYELVDADTLVMEYAGESFVFRRQ